MKVMLKLVPNHSSTSNLFFERSVLNETKYQHYYIWNPGFSNGVSHFPINNWVFNNHLIILFKLLIKFIFHYKRKVLVEDRLGNGMMAEKNSIFTSSLKTQQISIFAIMMLRTISRYLFFLISLFFFFFFLHVLTVLG